MKPGTLVYFKKCKTTNRHKTPEITFKGNGIGILLGHVPHFAPDIQSHDLFVALGSIGFLRFDEVGEFLGEEAMKTVVGKFMDKYGPKREPTSQEALNTVSTASPSQLVDAHGKGLINDESTI